MTRSTVARAPRLRSRLVLALALALACASWVADSPRAAGFDINAVKSFLRDKIPLGDINHKFLLRPPKVDDPKIGKSKSFPAALKIMVARDGTGFPAGIGKVVHDALFPGRPLTFKVVFACAKTDLLGRSDYANPNSIWYNVFFGYYEIEVKKRIWGRPFGYEEDAPNADIASEDLVRIGKADWNHFSNELYGVPADAIRPFDQVNMDEVDMDDPRRVQVGRRFWDLIEMSGVRVVGPYRSPHDGRKYVDRDKVVGTAWRFAFGTFNKEVGVKRSFGGTSMRAQFLMSYKKERDSLTGEEVYKTYMFGGTVNEGFPDKAENERFLGLQMDSLRSIVRKERNLGFSSP